MDKRDYYEVLGLKKGATEQEIKSAYRKKAKELHPYSVLSDENKKKMYDQFGHAGVSGNGPSNPYGAGGTYTNFDPSDFGFGDIFDSIFGGMGGGFSGFGGGRSSNRPSRGSDILMHLNLEFEEAIYGCEKKFNLDVVEDCEACHGHGGFEKEECETCHGTGSVTRQQNTILGSFMSKTTCPDCKGKGYTYKRRCSECNGKGKVKVNKKITINIPEGINTGDRQRLTGKGNPGINGGENGDLYIEFIVKKHRYFERNEDDIYIEVPLTLTESILGCKKDIPTLYGNVKINVPAGTNSGDTQRIKGKGVDNKYRRVKGDMYLVFKVYTPNKLTREQKDLIERLSNTELETDEIKKFNKFTKEND